MINIFFTPHNPLLISKIGQKHSKKLSKSIEALKNIRKKIYQINPDKIFIISPANQNSKKIGINQSEKYLIDFKEFGDLSLKFESPGDLDYSTRLKEKLEKNNFPINLYSDNLVDYKNFVAFYYLNRYHSNSQGFKNELRHKKNLKNEFIVINAAQGNLKQHLKFGELFYNFLIERKERIVIIACGDLLKHSKKNNGFQDIDNFINNLKKNNYQELNKTKKELEKKYYPGLKPLMMILNLISKLDLKINILALEKKFDEIYLSAEFIKNSEQ